MTVDTDGLWLAFVSTVIYLVWVDHAHHAFRLWFHERTMRSFRNLFIAVMLQVGFLRIVIGSMVRATPENLMLERIQDITAPVLSLLILSGGFVVAYTWRQR